MTDTIPPIMFRWDGEAMRPRQPKLADRLYVVGEDYALEPYKHRSKKSHDHWFVLVEETFNNLPEAMDGRWRSVEHFRKWLLIRAGWCEERTIVCASKAEAQRVAAYGQSIDDYAVVIPRENIVTHYTAKSQRYAAQDRKEFQAVKDRGLQIMAELLGVEPAALETARAA